MDPRRYFKPLCLLTALALAACTTTPSVPPEPSRDYQAEAQAALDNGARAEAARLLEEAAAATTDPERKAEFTLQAARIWLSLSEPEAARALLERLPERLPEPLAAERGLLNARLLLETDQPQAALTLLDGEPPQAVRQAWLELRAKALAALGRPLDAARALDQALADTEEPGLRRVRATALWALLSSMPMESLRTLMPPPPDELGGWLELNFLVRNHRLEPGELTRVLQEWQHRYPGHPAAADILPEVVRIYREQVRPPEQIALLLPLSGPLASAGAAIYDGFVAAYYAGKGTPPTVRVYDVGADGSNALAAYEQAVSAGADIVVGPLRKESLIMLSARGNLPVPVLALNTLPAGQSAPPEFYQFGLPPEDEAAAAADYAYAQGRERALVLVPEGEWGTRVADAFTEAFVERGGSVLERAYYEAGQTDFSDPIQAALNLDASELRHRELRSKLRRAVEFEPYRRQDVDVIFIGAYPREGRLIRPQLRFFHAIDVPVLATSHVYTGTEDARADQDLDGVAFVDMPWLLQPDPEDTTLSRAVLAATLDVRAAPRLYALGIDAYRLIPYLQLMRQNPGESLDGKTGMLSLDESGRIHRRLVPARFVNGAVRTEAQTQTFGTGSSRETEPGPIR